MSTLSPKHQKLSPCSMRALQISQDIPPSLSISKAIMAMTSRKLSRASAVLLQGMGNVNRCNVVITAELELAVGHRTISEQTSRLCNHSYIQSVNMSVMKACSVVDGLSLFPTTNIIHTVRRSQLTLVLQQV